jgi:hypothetical protein
MATEIQRLTFTNHSNLQGRYINLYNSNLGSFTATGPWNSGNLAQTLTYLLGGYSSYFNSYSVISDNDDTVVFELEFAAYMGDVGTTSLNAPLDPYYGVGADLRCTQIIAGMDPDEYGYGGSKEKWQLGYYNNVMPIAGTWTLRFYANNTDNETSAIPYNYVSYTEFSLTYALGFEAISGNLNPSVEAFYMQQLSEGTISQPAITYHNIDSVVSNFSASVIREGATGDGGAALMGAAT